MKQATSEVVFVGSGKSCCWVWNVLLSVLYCRNEEKRVNPGEDACYFPTTPSVFILAVGARLVNMRISILIAALMVMYVGPTTHTEHHPLSPSHSFGSPTEARQSYSWDYYTTLGVIRDPVRHPSKGSQVHSGVGIAGHWPHCDLAVQ